MWVLPSAFRPRCTAEAKSEAHLFLTMSNVLPGTRYVLPGPMKCANDRSKRGFAPTYFERNLQSFTETDGGCGNFRALHTFPVFPAEGPDLLISVLHQLGRWVGQRIKDVAQFWYRVADQRNPLRNLFA